MYGTCPPSLSSTPSVAHRRYFNVMSKSCKCADGRQYWCYCHTALTINRLPRSGSCISCQWRQDASIDAIAVLSIKKTGKIKAFPGVLIIEWRTRDNNCPFPFLSLPLPHPILSPLPLPSPFSLFPPSNPLSPALCTQTTGNAMYNTYMCRYKRQINIRNLGS